MKQIYHLRDSRRYTSDPQQPIVIEIQVDIEKLARAMGPKAFYSKGKKSRAMRGAVLVKFVRTWVPV